jgi:hypothetical protein
MSNPGGTVRMTVEQHLRYDPERPEAFNWTIVMNPKVQLIAESLSIDIVRRQDEWESGNGQEDDPLIPGLQEALRHIARIAVWATMTKEKAKVEEPLQPSLQRLSNVLL